MPEEQKRKFGSSQSQELEAPKKFASYDGEKANWYKLEDGEHFVRLLPPLNDAKVYHRVDLHFKVMVDGEERAVLCPKVKYGRCPICEDAEAHRKLGSKEDKYKAFKLSPQSKFLFNAMFPDGSVKVLSLDAKCYEEIRKVSETRMKLKQAPLWDAKQGRMILITKSKGEKGKRQFAPNVFSVGVSDEVVPVTVQNAEAILAGMADLTKLYKDWTYEELAEKYFGVSVKNEKIEDKEQLEEEMTGQIEESILKDDVLEAANATLAELGIED